MATWPTTAPNFHAHAVCQYNSCTSEYYKGKGLKINYAHFCACSAVFTLSNFSPLPTLTWERRDTFPWPSQLPCSRHGSCPFSHRTCSIPCQTCTLTTQLKHRQKKHINCARQQNRQKKKLVTPKRQIFDKRQIHSKVEAKFFYACKICKFKDTTAHALMELSSLLFVIYCLIFAQRYKINYIQLLCLGLFLG